jgi:hypothetical protein
MTMGRPDCRAGMNDKHNGAMATTAAPASVKRIAIESLRSFDMGLPPKVDVFVAAINTLSKSPLQRLSAER